MFLLAFGRLPRAEFRRGLQETAGMLDPAPVAQFAAARRRERAITDGIAALPLPPELREATESWLTAGRSPHTRRAYLLDLGGWLRWIDQLGIDPRRAGPEDAAAYRAGLALAAAGVTRRLSALSSWYDRLGIDNPIRAIRTAPDRGPSLTRTLTRDETRLLLAAADAMTSTGEHARARASRRDRVLVRLLAELGLNVAEATVLSMADLSITTDGLAVMIRGIGKFRDLTPSPTLQAHLNQLAAERRRTLLIDRLRREFTWGQPAVDHPALYAELDHRDQLPADWSDPAMDKRLAALAARPHALEVYQIYRTRRDAIYRFTTGELAVEQPAGLLLATGTGQPLRQAQVFATVRRLARAAGLADPEGVGPRGLRATAARAMLEDGHMLREVQQRLGHADPRTTARYQT